MKIKENPNKEYVHTIRLKLKENDGYCPCASKKNEDTKCMCKAFKQQNTPGECHCGLYVKE